MVRFQMHLFLQDNPICVELKLLDQFYILHQYQNQVVV